jgi:hypothetical protein
MSRPWHEIVLTIRSTRADDVYKDVARISQADRGQLRTGRVHFFKTASGKGRYLILRGVAVGSRGFVLVDSETRRKLGLETNEPTHLRIREACFFEELFWGCGATDPTLRASSRVAAISLGLGLISVLLGAISVWLGWLALHPVPLPRPNSERPKVQIQTFAPKSEGVSPDIRPR